MLTFVNDCLLLSRKDNAVQIRILLFINILYLVNYTNALLFWYKKVTQLFRPFSL